jgi:uncharacterized protein (DUF58 family)
MGARALRGDLLGIDQTELSRLGRMGSRLLYGFPSLPHGSSPRRLRPGTGLEILDRTNYAVGQDPRFIDWRATARSQKTLVRRYQDEALFSVYLCLDRSASMGADGGNRWLLARRIVAALTYLLGRAGNRVGLLEFSAGLDRVEPPGRGRASFVRILAALAAENLPDGEASCLEACLPLVTTGSSVIVVSDFLAPDALRRGLDLLQHRRCRVQAIQILSHSETAVTAECPIVLRDVETGERRRLRLDGDMCAAATRRLAEHRQQLREHCRERGIPFTQCESAAPWRDVIVSHLRTLEPFHA